MNKEHWNSVYLDGDVPDEVMKQSYHGGLYKDDPNSRIVELAGISQTFAEIKINVEVR